MSLFVYFVKMLFYGINENISFVFVWFIVILWFCFVEKCFFYRFWIFFICVGVVIKKKMDYVFLVDFIIILVKIFLLMIECVIFVIYWYVLFICERLVSFLSMYFEDIRYERWLFFYFEMLLKEISIFLKG